MSFVICILLRKHCAIGEIPINGSKHSIEHVENVGLITLAVLPKSHDFDQVRCFLFKLTQTSKLT